jgi:hypothetical protein
MSLFVLVICLAIEGPSGQSGFQQGQLGGGGGGLKLSTSTAQSGIACLSVYLSSEYSMAL